LSSPRQWLAARRADPVFSPNSEGCAGAPDAKVLLSWDSEGVRRPAVSGFKEHFPDFGQIVRTHGVLVILLRALRRSSGNVGSGDDVAAGLDRTVRYLRAVLTSLRIDQPVVASVHRLTASAASKMVRCASIESRVRW
jgi:hypothetical protein